MVNCLWSCPIILSFLASLVESWPTCFVLEQCGFIPVRPCKRSLQYTVGLPLQYPATTPSTYWASYFTAPLLKVVPPILQPVPFPLCVQATIERYEPPIHASPWMLITWCYWMVQIDQYTFVYTVLCKLTGRCGRIGRVHASRVEGQTKKVSNWCFFPP